MDFVRFDLPDGAIYLVPVKIAERQTVELAELLASYRAGRGGVVPLNADK